MAHATGFAIKPLVKVPMDLNAPCWPWSGAIDSSGYGRKDIQGESMTCQRYIWLCLHGAVPVGAVIGPACGNRACANPQHVRCYVGMVDAQRKGSGAALTPGDVAEIKRQRKSRTKFTAKLLADKLGVDPQAIRNIWKGRTWSDRPRKTIKKDEAA